MTSARQAIDNEVEITNTRGHDIEDHPMGAQCAKCNAIFINEGAVDGECPVSDEDHPIDE